MLSPPTSATSIEALLCATFMAQKLRNWRKEVGSPPVRTGPPAVQDTTYPPWVRQIAGTFDGPPGG
jgi:hypothetical protein